jgi:hypothetical protein
LFRDYPFPTPNGIKKRPSSTAAVCDIVVVVVVPMLFKESDLMSNKRQFLGPSRSRGE